ncbi:hypothetical protein EVAR_830_1 [Eumeta japonica]|uniref:Uncharacterized protein n=1 Tax=Eumeta variegata TaxID=151549 RepID=A0A4C1SDU1_EUMVA|nr:hypothetical protein EVAR_830_1 [Eumeta japonica]
MRGVSLKDRCRKNNVKERRGLKKDVVTKRPISQLDISVNREGIVTLFTDFTLVGKREKCRCGAIFDNRVDIASDRIRSGTAIRIDGMDYTDGRTDERRAVSVGYSL